MGCAGIAQSGTSDEYVEGSVSEALDQPCPMPTRITRPEDYANPIEPSVTGGAKLAGALGLYFLKRQGIKPTLKIFLQGIQKDLVIRCGMSK